MEKLVNSISTAGDQPITAGRKPHSGVQSIERAFAILEEIARDREGVNLAELSKRIGLHNSTTFHLVKTMVLLGYVQQVKDSKKYRIGRRLFTLAASSLDELQLINLANPILEELTRVTGESGQLAVRSGDDVVIIAKAAAAGAFQLTDRVGGARPAHCTALGKVLLAARAQAELERYVRTSELRPFTAKTIVEAEPLLREIDEVRRNGIAFDDGEFNAEIRCVAVPVYDLTGQVIAAIGISGPIWRLSLQALQDKSQRVRAAAARLSQEFGFEPTAKSVTPGGEKS